LFDGFIDAHLYGWVLLSVWLLCAYPTLVLTSEPTMKFSSPASLTSVEQNSEVFNLLG
jgi:hypothetical protein